MEEIRAELAEIDELLQFKAEIHAALDCETECPCCQERDLCAEECSFAKDDPDAFARLQFMRDTLHAKFRT